MDTLPFAVKDEEGALKSKFSAKYKANEGQKELLFDQIEGAKSTCKLVVRFKANDD